MISDEQLSELRFLLEVCDDEWIKDSMSISANDRGGIIIDIVDINEQHLPGLLGLPE